VTSPNNQQNPGVKINQASPSVSAFNNQMQSPQQSNNQPGLQIMQSSPPERTSMSVGSKPQQNNPQQNNPQQNNTIGNTNVNGSGMANPNPNPTAVTFRPDANANKTQVVNGQQGSGSGQKGVDDAFGKFEVKKGEIEFGENFEQMNVDFNKEFANDNWVDFDNHFGENNQKAADAGNVNNFSFSHN